MEDWDQETLEKVVESKKNEYNQNKPTEIVCQFQCYDICIWLRCSLSLPLQLDLCLSIPTSFPTYPPFKCFWLLRMEYGGLSGHVSRYINYVSWVEKEREKKKGGKGLVAWDVDLLLKLVLLGGVGQLCNHWSYGLCYNLNSWCHNLITDLFFWRTSHWQWGMLKCSTLCKYM